MLFAVIRCSLIEVEYLLGAFTVWFSLGVLHLVCSSGMFKNTLQYPIPVMVPISLLTAHFKNNSTYTNKLKPISKLAVNILTIVKLLYALFEILIPP